MLDLRACTERPGVGEDIGTGTDATIPGQAESARDLLVELVTNTTGDRPAVTPEEVLLQVTQSSDIVV